MGLIEQAAERLAQLRRAGVEPSPTQEAPEAGMPPAHPPSHAAHSPFVGMAPPPQPHAAAGPHAAAPHAGHAPGATPLPFEAKAGSRPRAPKVELDLAGLAAMGYVTPDKPHSRIANEFRILKRPLIANAVNPQIRNGNLIIVTSAVPSDGKSFVTVNLAMSLAAEFDKTVLLVDADVARPSLPGILGIEERPGLLDVLNRSAPLEQAIVRTNVERLTFLPSGRQRPHASEILASDAMAHLLAELASRYQNRIILFDSPPILATTEARVLATRMGQVVFVVKSGVTLQAQAKQALAAIEACPVKLMVLNAAPRDAVETYGYGYGYGYGRSDADAGE